MRVGSEGATLRQLAIPQWTPFRQADVFRWNGAASPVRRILPACAVFPGARSRSVGLPRVHWRWRIRLCSRWFPLECRMEGRRMRLEGKTAVITGAASGFGAEMARRFAAEGARVVAADLNGAGAAAVADELGEAGVSVEGDVSLREDAACMIQAALDRFGRARHPGQQRRLHPSQPADARGRRSHVRPGIRGQREVDIPDRARSRSCAPRGGRGHNSQHRVDCRAPAPTWTDLVQREQGRRCSALEVHGGRVGS